MLLNTYEPWKFAFSQEETDFNNLKEGAWGRISLSELLVSISAPTLAASLLKRNQALPTIWAWL